MPKASFVCEFCNFTIEVYPINIDGLTAEEAKLEYIICPICFNKRYIPVNEDVI